MSNNPAKELKESTDNWIKETTRNYRIIDLCIGIPVEYQSNVILTEEHKQRYLKCKDMAYMLREMVADNIRLPDIAIFLKLPLDGIESIIKKIVKPKTESNTTKG